jgi:hypothetical protein
MFIEYFVSTLIIGLFLIKFYIIGHLGQVLVSKFERFQIIDYIKLSIFEKIFVGFFISIQLLYLNHFLLNLNYNFRFAYFTIFLIIGILLFMINYKLLKKSLANEKFLSLVFLIILFLLTFVGKLTVKPTFVDSVATHIPLEKLFINNPIIFGLGNLDPYMGYGSPLSLVSAVYNFSLGTNEFRLTVFLFILMMLLITLSELLKGNKSILWKLTLIIYNLGVIFIAYSKPSEWLSSPNYDLPAACLYLILMVSTLNLLKNQNFKEMFIYIISAAFLLEIRINSIIVIFLSLFLLFVKWRSPKYIITFPISILLVSFLSSVERFILTGYFFYPLTLFSFNVSWRMNKDFVSTKMFSAQDYVANNEFIRGAFRNDLVLNACLLSFLILFVTLILYLFCVNSIELKVSFKNSLVILFLINQLNILLWWFSIPMIRYIWGSLFFTISLNLTLSIYFLRLLLLNFRFTESVVLRLEKRILKTIY